jgi:hypothetical protein
MPKHLVNVPRTSGLDGLDIVSHGRNGPAGSVLSPEQVAQVARTVRRTPEVMVKVSGGARDVGGAKAHFSYIDRHGREPILTDDSRALTGKGAAADLVDDWNLDLCAGQYRPRPAEGERDRRPKIVHNIILSMPAPTPPAAVLAAAQRFARENFALQYRYAMVLHTDQRHPHVHLVVKAEQEFEPHRRLHITKPMLRQWRENFARCLRAQGVAANATPGPLRGRNRQPLKDPIHRRLKAVAAFHALPADAQTRVTPPKPSSFMRSKVEAIARQLQRGSLSPEPGRARLVEIRERVRSGWQSVADALRRQQLFDLANEVERFKAAMPPARTDQERIAAGLLAEVLAQRKREDGRATDAPRRPPRGGE